MRSRAVAEPCLATSYFCLGGAPKELEDAGKKLYEEGVPSAEIKPCANPTSSPCGRFCGRVDLPQ